MANRRVGEKKTGTRRREIFGILFIAAGLFFGLALFSYSPLDRSWGSVSTSTTVHNLIGPFGAYLSDALFQFLGGGAMLLPFYMLVYGINKLSGKEPSYRILKILGALILIVSLSTILRLRWEHLSFGGIRAGGIVGELITVKILDVFGVAGSYILTVTLLLCGMVVSTTFSLMSIIRGVKAYSLSTYERARNFHAMYTERKRKTKMKEEREEAEPEPPPEIVVPVRKPAPAPEVERLQEQLP